MRLFNKAFFKVAMFYLGIYLLHFSILRTCALHYSIYFLYVTFIFVSATLFIMLALKVYQEEALKFAKHQSFGQFLSGICSTLFMTLPLQVYDLVLQNMLAKSKLPR